MKTSSATIYTHDLVWHRLWIDWDKQRLLESKETQGPVTLRMLLKEQWIDVGSQMQTMLKKWRMITIHKGVLAVRATCICIYICIGYTSIIFNKVFWSVINTVEILDLVLNCQIYLNQTKPNPHWLRPERVVGFTSLCFDPLKSDGHVSF